MSIGDRIKHIKHKGRLLHYDEKNREVDFTDGTTFWEAVYLTKEPPKAGEYCYLYDVPGWKYYIISTLRED